MPNYTRWILDPMKYVKKLCLHSLPAKPKCLAVRANCHARRRCRPWISNSFFSKEKLFTVKFYARAKNTFYQIPVKVVFAHNHCRQTDVHWIYRFTLAVSTWVRIFDIGSYVMDWILRCSSDRMSQWSSDWKF